ncbi:dinitrogenase iron-molybdenum cofactor N-terminal domain-containing protein [Halioxenophilus sp. WMMB6]|uniref:dinitrogenase iron-molybdenum cofactor N-terminal domain-containing protein n=1 Tax=Halioxenophilus sp. WMMB6 TaxID=3073815 RepID=UPI00295F14BE|nr:dinitrogenase iron-molybdenum cofactor N-terminal domain-containing protein [Halioxenophilus sp. WMMB6]
MSASNLEREAALKIALAARILPGITVSQLLEVLFSRLDGEINEETLKTVTVTDLKTSFASVDGEEDGEDIGIGLEEMKEAVRILWGESTDEESIKMETFEGPQEGSIRVAVASNSEEQLNGHFGSCIRYLIYQMSGTELKLIDARSALAADFSDDKNLFRANLIADCDVGYFVSVGGPAAAKVIRAGVYIIKEIAGGEAREVLGRLQQVMAGSPPPWLAKIMGAKTEDRIRCESLKETSIEE